MTGPKLSVCMCESVHLHSYEDKFVQGCGKLRGAYKFVWEMCCRSRFWCYSDSSNY